MSRILKTLFGTDPLKKRIRRGLIGAGISVILSALGGGIAEGDLLFAVIFLGGFVGIIVGALTLMNLLRLIGLGLMLAGASIILELTVQPMEKDLGLWYFGLGLATWWTVIKRFFENRKKIQD